MPINNGNEVSIHYTAKIENGEIIESTKGKSPLHFKIGSQKLLPALEEALIGLEKGDKKEVTVPPDKGFGERKDDLLQKVPKTMVKEGIPPSPGAVVELKTQDGSKQLATIHEVLEDSIVFDLNHPLAGTTLTFDIEIVDVTP